MWLASISYKRHNQFVPTERWSPTLIRRAQQIASEAMIGVGDPTKERAVPMTCTACCHRLATPEEIEAMPPGPGSLAGPPIRQQILWSTPDAPPCAPSFAPCDNRTYVTRYGQRQAVDDCGNCPSCRARQQTLDDARKKWEAVNTNQSHG